VLNIGRLGGDLDAVVAYYAVDVRDAGMLAAADYYVGHESGGRWVGSLREQLGVGGSVGNDEFRRMLEGRHPATGELLTLGAQSRASRSISYRVETVDTWLDVAEVAKHLNVGRRHVRKLLERGTSASESQSGYLKGEKSSAGRGRWKVSAVEVNRFLNERESRSARPGFDLTLRPPKSVSILWALGSSEISNTIADAHREAVDEVIHYYEQHAVFSRKRVKGEQLRISTSGLIGAAFDHRTSRAGDPLLHTHVVVFNATLCSDGDWRSIEAPTLYEHAKTGGYLYQAHLRHALAKSLGLSWTSTVNGCAEVEGVPPMLIDHFSKRRDEIERAASLAGHSSASAMQTAALATRKAKSISVEPPVEIERWRREAADLGFDADRLVEGAQAALPAQMSSVEMSVEDPVETFVEMSGPNGLTKMTSTFTERDVIRELSRRASSNVGARDIAAMASRFIEGSEPVRLRGGHDDDRIIVGDGIGRASSVTRYTTSELFTKEAELMAWAKSSFAGNGSTVPMAIVEGVLRVKSGLSDEQRQMVYSLSRSGNRLHLVAGRPGSGKTYAMKVAVESFAAAGVRVVGAAVSAEAAAELEASVNLSAYMGQPACTIARLLADLDNPESRGFAAGTVLVLDEASMIGTRQLHRLVQHLDRADGSLVLLGDPDQHGSVEAGGMYRHLVEPYVERVVELKSNFRQVDPVDRQAIDAFRGGEIENAFGFFGDRGNVVRVATNADSLAAMTSDWFDRWKAGERSPMLAGRNDVRRALNERARRALRDAGELRSGSLVVHGAEFCVGDWVVARRNKTFDDGVVRRSIRNGSVGTVVGLDETNSSLTVEFDRGGRVTLPFWYLDENGLDHAYARTTYGVQGKTMDTALYQPTDVSSFEEGYVAITRAKSSTRIYLVDDASTESSTPFCGDVDSKLDDDVMVAKALSRRRAKRTAHEHEIDFP
jgi:conjugative relaxase-like TrwC/TraI family protein